MARRLTPGELRVEKKYGNRLMIFFSTLLFLGCQQFFNYYSRRILFFQPSFELIEMGLAIYRMYYIKYK